MNAALDLFADAAAAHDPGGIRTPIPEGVTSDAVYGGTDGCYRYLLEWSWDGRLPTLAVGMMNPSCAGHTCGDRTVAWVHRWAVRRGFGRLLVVNADAYRAMNQARLAEVDDPMGPDNETYIRLAGGGADMFCIGYGQPKVKAVRDHGPRMARILASDGVKLHVWGVSEKTGAPKHPLYLPGDTEARPWQPA